LLHFVGGARGFATAFDKDMALQSILSGEAFIAEFAREGFDREMDSLVPFQVMIAVEALRALVTFEGPLSLGWSGLAVVQEVAHARGVPAVEAMHHVRMHTSHESQLAVGIADVGEDWRWREKASIWTRISVRRLTGLRRH